MIGGGEMIIWWDKQKKNDTVFKAAGKDFSYPAYMFKTCKYSSQPSGGFTERAGWQFLSHNCCVHVCEKAPEKMATDNFLTATPYEQKHAAPWVLPERQSVSAACPEAGRRP